VRHPMRFVFGDPAIKDGPSTAPSTQLLPLRFDRHEIAGGCADIGVMIPLGVGVAAAAGLDLATVFLCTAALYAATAIVFRVPVPVQPMKAMAAAIIALGLSPVVVSAAGIEIGLLLLLIAVTPLARVLAHMFPLPVVRGIQLAIGVLLAKSALLMTGADAELPGLTSSGALGHVAPASGVLVALAVAVFLLASRQRRRVPGGLVVLVAGAGAGIVLATLGDARAAPAASASLPLLHLPSLADASLAFFAVVLPQLPLSLGNAVFATDDVLHHYHGDAARRVTPGRLSLSMGLANVGCGLLGGMPLCHGSGGATAHYRFGARTAGATVAAAGVYVVLAAGAGFGLSPLLVPSAFLAGMLLYVGVEHLLLVTDLAGADDVACAGAIAVVAVVTGDLALGFAVGWAVLVVLRRSRLHGLVLRWPAVTTRLAPAPEAAELEAQ
jgi:sulfate permease, SulP family